MTSYGIDFGTTNSVLACVSGGRVATLPLVDEIPIAWADLGFDRVLPSSFTVTNGVPEFGWPAKTRVGHRVRAEAADVDRDAELPQGGDIAPDAADIDLELTCQLRSGHRPARLQALEDGQEASRRAVHRGQISPE